MHSCEKDTLLQVGFGPESSVTLKNIITVLKITVLGVSIGLAFVMFKHFSGMNL